WPSRSRRSNGRLTTGGSPYDSARETNRVRRPRGGAHARPLASLPALRVELARRDALVGTRRNDLRAPLSEARRRFARRAAFASRPSPIACRSAVATAASFARLSHRVRGNSRAFSRAHRAHRAHREGLH